MYVLTTLTVIYVFVRLIYTVIPVQIEPFTPYWNVLKDGENFVFPQLPLPRPFNEPTVINAPMRPGVQNKEKGGKLIG